MKAVNYFSFIVKSTKTALKSGEEKENLLEKESLSFFMRSSYFLECFTRSLTCLSHLATLQLFQILRL